jgi:hypothetical protein
MTDFSVSKKAGLHQKVYANFLLDFRKEKTSFTLKINNFFWAIKAA